MLGLFTAADLLLLLTGLLIALGHAFLWAAYVNQVHARGWPRPIVKLLTFPALLIVIPIGSLEILYRLVQALPAVTQQSVVTIWNTYDWLCFPLGCWAVGRWLYWRVIGDPLAVKIAAKVTQVDVTRELNQPLLIGKLPRLLGCWPWNESCRLETRVERLALPRLPHELTGLRVAHLSDWHFTGAVDRTYFNYLVERVNELAPDIICLTGDLIDNRDCLDWLPTIFGALHAPQGKFYVLGNHDPRCGDLPALHDQMTAIGFIDVGGTWRTMTIRNTPVLFAGCELPWLGPAADLQYAPRDQEGHPLFRLLLAHTPDCFDLATRYDFDLQLSGHTHGGQVALPIIGPVFAPSRHGVRFACGTFRRKNTVLHVTRGVSSMRPLRWNSPPTISLLILEQES